jgi:hypothetical protein
MKAERDGGGEEPARPSGPAKDGGVAGFVLPSLPDR